MLGHQRWLPFVKGHASWRSHCTHMTCLVHCTHVMGTSSLICAVTGKMVYHGPKQGILPFFETQGMFCPERKADSDFLQEVTSRKDQEVSLCTMQQAMCLLCG